VVGDTAMTWFDAEGAVIEESDDWLWSDDFVVIESLASSLGAFELSSFLESAIIAQPEPGSFTVHVEDVDEVGGRVLFEAYDADGENARGRLINLSTRTGVGSGGSGDVLTAGFVIEGHGLLRVLVRGVGPTLGGFGVPDVLADPAITLFGAESEVLAENDDWAEADGDVAAAGVQVG